MKKSLIAALLGATFASAAMAQSSVQIYGIADAGVMWQKGGPTKVYSGGADGSRIGFKGTEDIGNGYKAIFNLEARVELDNGSQQPALMNDNPGRYLLRNMQGIPQPILDRLQATIQPPGAPAVNQEKALFDRTAMVGLITPIGAVLIGRMYTPGYEVFNMADTFESGTAGTWGHITGGTAGFTALGADIRSQESIQYRIATPGGFGAAVMYGARNSGYLGRYNKFRAVNGTYKANGFDVGVGYNHGYDRQNRPSLRTTTVGGSYTINDTWKVFAGFHSQRNDNSALLPDYLDGWDSAVVPALTAQGIPTGVQGQLRGIFERNITANTIQDARSYQAGLHYRFGNSRIVLQYAHQNDRTPSNSDANLYAVGYNYYLSKRTDLYTVAAWIKNDNEAQYAPGTSGNPGGFTETPGADGRAFQLGIRHRF